MRHATGRTWPCIRIHLATHAHFQRARKFRSRGSLHTCCPNPTHPHDSERLPPLPHRHLSALTLCKQAMPDPPSSQESGNPDNPGGLAALMPQASNPQALPAAARAPALFAGLPLGRGVLQASQLIQTPATLPRAVRPECRPGRGMFAAMQTLATLPEAARAAPASDARIAGRAAACPFKKP